MKLNNLKATLYGVGFKIKKHSPEILIGVGCIGVVTSTVMACKATTKLSGILEDAESQIGEINKVMENEDIMKAYDYTEEDGKKDLTIVYAQTGLKLVKLYAPAVVVGALSLGCIIKSHDILKKRNVAIAAAYSTISKGFKDYRDRVIDRFGERIDYELKHNIKATEIEVTEVDENGEEVTTKKTVDVADSHALTSPYSRFFDESSRHWKKNPAYNLDYLLCTQEYFNKVVPYRDVVLNEVYRKLDIPETDEGMVIGWKRGSKIDFGIFNVYSPAKRDFVNGYERNVLLDFNVDGNLYGLKSKR